MGLISCLEALSQAFMWDVGALVEVLWFVARGVLSQSTRHSSLRACREHVELLERIFCIGLLGGI